MFIIHKLLVKCDEIEIASVDARPGAFGQQGVGINWSDKAETAPSDRIPVQRNVGFEIPVVESIRVYRMKKRVL